MKNFLTRFFQLTKRDPLPFIPLRAINVPIESARASQPPRRRWPGLHVFETSNDQQHTNQLSS